MDRRDFIMTQLAAGFALAVQPVSAQTITTSSAGLMASEVKVKVKDGAAPAYHAMPLTGKDWPVTLVIQEIFGVHEHIKDMCRRFAKIGHMAIAVELYARQGDVSKLTDIQQILAVVNKVPDDQFLSDLDAAVAWAKENGGNTSKLGVTGFCWGGRATWMYAAHNPNVKAAAAWYGPLTGTPSAQKPKNPVDVASQLKVPVLGLYGGMDTGIPPADIERMRAALKAANNPSEIVVYPNAQHGFNADYRPSYDKASADDGWQRLQAWFKKYGAA